MAKTTGTDNSTCVGACFGDREMITDLLSSQKALTGSYNTFLNECESETVKNCFASILTDEHGIQNGLFTDMQSRGWYATAKADEQKLAAAKSKFSADVTK